MSCTCNTESRSGGFTLVELMLVISLIALLLAMSGTSLLDQLRAQQVANAISQGRDLATIVEQIRPAIREAHESTFRPHASAANPDRIYKKKLYDFMNDMNLESDLRSALLDGFYTSEDVLGSVAGGVYFVTLTENATFVTIKIDNSYSAFTFFSTAKPLQTEATWIVTSRVSSPLIATYNHLNEINK